MDESRPADDLSSSRSFSPVGTNSYINYIKDSTSEDSGSSRTLTSSGLMLVLFPQSLSFSIHDSSVASHVCLSVESQKYLREQ